MLDQSNQSVNSQDSGQFVSNNETTWEAEHKQSFGQQSLQMNTEWDQRVQIKTQINLFFGALENLGKVNKYEKLCATCYESNFQAKPEEYKFKKSHIDPEFRQKFLSCMISKGYSLKDHASIHHSNNDDQFEFFVFRDCGKETNGKVNGNLWFKDVPNTLKGMMKHGTAYSRVDLEKFRLRAEALTPAKINANRRTRQIKPKTQNVKTQARPKTQSAQTQSKRTLKGEEKQQAFVKKLLRCHAKDEAFKKSLKRDYDVGSEVDSVDYNAPEDLSNFKCTLPRNQALSVANNLFQSTLAHLHKKTHHNFNKEVWHKCLYCRETAGIVVQAIHKSFKWSKQFGSDLVDYNKRYHWTHDQILDLEAKSRAVYEANGGIDKKKQIDDDNLFVLHTADQNRDCHDVNAENGQSVDRAVDEAIFAVDEATVGLGFTNESKQLDSDSPQSLFNQTNLHQNNLHQDNLHQDNLHQDLPQLNQATNVRQQSKPTKQSTLDSFQSYASFVKQETLRQQTTAGSVGTSVKKHETPLNTHVNDDDVLVPKEPETLFDVSGNAGILELDLQYEPAQYEPFEPPVPVYSGWNSQPSQQDQYPVILTGTTKQELESRLADALLRIESMQNEHKKMMKKALDNQDLWKARHYDAVHGDKNATEAVRAAAARSYVIKSNKQHLNQVKSERVRNNTVHSIPEFQQPLGLETSPMSSTPRIPGISNWKPNKDFEYLQELLEMPNFFDTSGRKLFKELKHSEIEMQNLQNQ